MIPFIIPGSRLFKGESTAEYVKRMQWRVEVLMFAVKVIIAAQWTIDNPPPKTWQGDGLDWCYTEMPAWKI